MLTRALGAGAAEQLAARLDADAMDAALEVVSGGDARLSHRITDLLKAQRNAPADELGGPAGATR